MSNEGVRQRMAALDGHVSRGGCKHCDATYEWTTISLGESRIDIYHDVDCPIGGIFPHVIRLDED